MSNIMQVSDTLKKFISGFSSILKRSLLLKAGFTILLFLLFIIIFEPVFNIYLNEGNDPLRVGVYERVLPSSLKHPIGTDNFGRDLLMLNILGVKYSLFIGVIAGGTSTLIAVSLAVLAGYFGGKIDYVLGVVTNGMLVIPSLPILMVLAMYVRLDIITMALIIAAFGWPWATRTIRAQILTLKERGYIELAKVSGLGNFKIMFVEILPNLIPYIGVSLSFSVIGAILTETGLRVIGLGPSEIPTLGQLLSWALSWGAISMGYYIMVLGPTIFLIMIFVAFQFINAGLEEIFNPRLKKVTGL
jgi:peptide/nickel transport system permease protein